MRRPEMLRPGSAVIPKQKGSPAHESCDSSPNPWFLQGTDDRVRARPGAPGRAWLGAACVTCQPSGYPDRRIARPRKPQAARPAGSRSLLKPFLKNEAHIIEVEPGAFEIFR